MIEVAYCPSCFPKSKVALVKVGKGRYQCIRCKYPLERQRAPVINPFRKLWREDLERALWIDQEPPCQRSAAAWVGEFHPRYGDLNVMASAIFAELVRRCLRCKPPPKFFIYHGERLRLSYPTSRLVEARSHRGKFICRVSVALPEMDRRWW